MSIQDIHSERIDQREFFGKTLKEGKGGSFDVMAQWPLEEPCLIYLSFFPVEEVETSRLVPTHPIRKDKLQDLIEHNITDEQEPLSVVMANDLALIFDGHHRGALAKMNNQKTVKAHVVEIPFHLAERIEELISEGR